jgi:histidinol-phosphate phosphatase family protein
LKEAGFKVVVVTNQSGVGRGYFTEETLQRIHARMSDELASKGARLDGIYYCPHHPDDNCECRKPKSAMFRRAAKELCIDLSRSYMVGDMALDVEAGQAAGCKTILLAEPTACRTLNIGADKVAGTLAEVAAWILNERAVLSGTNRL